MERWMKVGLSLALVVVWLALLVWVDAPAAAQSGAITQAEYWQLVADTQALVAQLDEDDQNASARLAASAERWQAITAVNLPAGGQVAVDHSYLVAQLRAEPPDWAYLLGLLTTLLAARADWPAAQFTTSDLTSLERILSRPEFRYGGSALPGWLRWIVEQWQRFLEWLNNLSPAENPAAGDGFLAAPLVEQLATVVLLLLLAGLLAYALQGILADFAAESVLALEETATGEPLTADGALRRAQELSSGGDYRSAVRYLYLSTLLRLEERGLLRYDRSLTNREYLKRVAHDPSLAKVLRDVVEVFDRVWYGYQPLDALAYQRYASAVEALKNYR
jgi:hypothetical protein